MLTHTSSIFIFLDISLSIDIFFKDGVSKFLAQVHIRPKAHPVCLILIVVINNNSCYSECTQINVESLQIRKMY